MSCVLRMSVGAGFGLIYTYLGELFPTRIRGLAIGVMILGGRIGASMTTFITDIENYHDIHPFCFTIFINIIAFICLFFLPETFGKVIRN